MIGLIMRYRGSFRNCGGTGKAHIVPSIFGRSRANNDDGTGSYVAEDVPAKYPHNLKGEIL